MPAPVSKDSMSKCEAPSMLYDTIRRPNAPYVPPKPAVDPAALSKDTIETTQQRLNREVLERFQNTSSRLPHHSFVVVAQVGKYLFLAVMLPTYLCFFEIPRWMLMTALPQLFMTMKTETLRVGRFLSELTSKAVDTMKGVLEQLIGDSLRMFNQQSKNLFGYMAQKTSFLSKGVQQIAQIVQQNIEKMRSLLLRSKEKAMHEMEQFLQKIERFKDQVVQAAKRVVNILFYPLDLVDKYLFKPVSQWYAKQVAAVSNGVHRISVAAARSWQRISQPVVSFCKATVKSIYYPIYQSMQYLAQEAVVWLHPHMNRLRIGMDRLKEKLLQQGSKIFSRVRSKTKEIASAIADMIKQIPLPMQLMVQFMGWAWWQTSQITGSSWQFSKRRFAGGKRALTAIGRSLMSGAKGVARQGRWLAKGILHGLLWLLERIALAMYWIMKQLMTLPRKAVQGIIWSLKMCVRAIKYSVYGLRILVAWVWVISSYGMILVRELAQEIGRWFRGS